MFTRVKSASFPYPPASICPTILIRANMDPAPDYLTSDYPPSDLSSSSSEDNKKTAPTMDSRPTAKELLGTFKILATIYNLPSVSFH